MPPRLVAELPELASAAGAHQLIDRSRDDIGGRVLAVAPNGVDRRSELEFGLNVRSDARLLKRNGIIAGYSSPGVREPMLPSHELQRRGLTLRFVRVELPPPADRQWSIDGLKGALRDGRL